jgi:hypothetical protein
MRPLVVAAFTLVAVVGAAAALAGRSRDAAAVAAPTKGLSVIQQRLLSGTASRALDAQSSVRAGEDAQRLQSPAGPAAVTGCPVDRGANVQVNQECQNLTDPDLAGRGQAQNEPAIAQDPRNPARAVASSNDYRRGDSGCYAYTSGTGGRRWQDSTPPTGFTRGASFGGVARQYWQAGGDTSVAWDTKGNAYLSCLTFKRGQPATADPDLSSAFYVLRSTGTGGASWNFPARPVAELDDTAGEGVAMLDKQYMTIDTREGSRFQDRIYVTWTFFASDGTAYIYAAYSRDYGERFSRPKLVSAGSALCPQDLDVPTPEGDCTVNQFSQPFTGPDGTLYVVWHNYNVTAPGDEDNRAQVLLAKSADGGDSFSAPVKVADFYDFPDCATYQGESEGAACIPEKGNTSNSIFRAANYPSGAVDPADPSRVMVTFGSYINQHSGEDNGCVPRGYDGDTFLPLYDGVKTAGACNNDIVVSSSADGGETFTGASTDVRELPATRPVDAGMADQFFQWAAFDSSSRLAVSYYDRGYGDDELTGFSDISLSGTRDGVRFARTRVTSSSMPPPTQFEGGFYGDYTGLSAAGGVAHPVWVDTRDPELFACRDSAGIVTLPPSVCTAGARNADQANDQNISTRAVPIPVP